MNPNERQIAAVSVDLIRHKLGKATSPIDLNHCTLHQLNLIVDALIEKEL